MGTHLRGATMKEIVLLLGASGSMGFVAFKELWTRIDENVSGNTTSFSCYDLLKRTRNFLPLMNDNVDWLVYLEMVSWRGKVSR